MGKSYIVSNRTFRIQGVGGVVLTVTVTAGRSHRNRGYEGSILLHVNWARSPVGKNRKGWVGSNLRIKVLTLKAEQLNYKIQMLIAQFTEI